MKEFLQDVGTVLVLTIVVPIGISFGIIGGIHVFEHFSGIEYCKPVDKK